MKLLILFMIVFFSGNTFSQEGTKPTISNTEKHQEMEIVDFPDVDAEFPGGTYGLNRFIGANMTYPEESLKKNEEGKVFLSFVVKADGSIDSIQVERGVSKNLDNEAVRLLTIMPRWNPAEYNGRKVATRVRFPISFTLN
jgi:TonB family protein